MFGLIVLPAICRVMSATTEGPGPGPGPGPAFRRLIIDVITMLWQLCHDVSFGLLCRQILRSHYHLQADKVGQVLESICCHF